MRSILGELPFGKPEESGIPAKPRKPKGTRKTKRTWKKTKNLLRTLKEPGFLDRHSGYSGFLRGFSGGFHDRYSRFSGY